MNPLVIVLVGAFVLVTLIVFGAYWMLVAQPEAKGRSKLHKRLKVDAGALTADSATSRLEKQTKEDVRSSFDAAVEKMSVVGPIQTLIKHADIKLSAGNFVLMSIVCAVIGYVLTFLAIRYHLVALGIATLAGLIPYFVVRHKRNRRFWKFEEQFPEAIDLIARALRAGHAFTTALAMVADEIPKPVGSEFRLLYDRQNYGMPLDEAMKDLADRIPLLDARFFVTAVLMQRETGGNLAEVLDNLATVIRERFQVKRQVRVLTAHGRITGWVLAGFPPALAMVMFVMVPGHLDVMVEDPLGVRMIVGAVTLQIIGTLAIQKLVNIEYSRLRCLLHWARCSSWSWSSPGS